MELVAPSDGSAGSGNQGRRTTSPEFDATALIGVGDNAYSLFWSSLVFKRHVQKVARIFKHPGES